MSDLSGLDRVTKESVYNLAPVLCGAETSHIPDGAPWATMAVCRREEGHHPATMHVGRIWAGHQGHTVLWRTEPKPDLP